MSGGSHSSWGAERLRATTPYRLAQALCAFCCSRSFSSGISTPSHPLSVTALAPCSWPTQFVVLLRRAMLGQLRNPTDTTSRLFLSTWVGVLAGG